MPLSINLRLSRRCTGLGCQITSDKMQRLPVRRHTAFELPSLYCLQNLAKLRPRLQAQSDKVRTRNKLRWMNRLRRNLVEDALHEPGVQSLPASMRSMVRTS